MAATAQELPLIWCVHGLLIARGLALTIWTLKPVMAEAVKWYRKAAGHGHSNAQYYLGCCYDSNEGVNKDMAEVVKWYRKAAGQGHSNAQFCLGCCYQFGEGLEQDVAEAVKWYRKAAEQGQRSATLAIATLVSLSMRWSRTMSWRRR